MNEYSFENIEKNRKLYLAELRSGKYKKGTILSDAKGRPIINSKADAEGSCACAIMLHLFDSTATTSTMKSRMAIGITGKQCQYIQEVLNDSDLTFEQIADRIEVDVFHSKSMTPISVESDDGGHWYIIPKQLVYDFHRDMENAEEDEYVKFNEKYSQYRTGGDINNIQLFANI